MTLKPAFQCLVSLFAAGALAGCATLTVSSHVERSADFSGYHAFAWGAPDALPTGDPRLDANADFRDHVEGAIEKQLSTRGLRQADPQSADVLVHYHANVAQRIDVDAADRQYGYSSGNARPGVVEFEQGTLVVDLIDARTMRLIWRGWAQDSINVNDRDRINRQVDEGVTRMFERFPLPLSTPPPAAR
jgi:hypothetical protein